ncbi:putative late embryogenesis abundant domain-containing protein, partial [Tanacetum coccineum]
KAKKVAEDVVGTVKDGASKAKNFDVVDSPKRIGEDIQRNVTGKIEESAEHVKEQAKETVHNVQQAGQKSLGEILSKLREVTYDVIWYMASRDKVDAVVGLIHMLGFSTAYGMCVWVTFVSSYILGRYLPRQQFAMVQSRIYPVYFKAMAYCVSAVLLGHLARKRNAITYSLMEMFQGLSLLSALMMVLTNMIVFEPKATKLMYERMKIEKEEGRGVVVTARDAEGDNGGATAVRQTTTVVADRQDVLRLTEKLKRLNTYSSALNVSTLVLLTWHMAYMGQKLQATR